MLECWDRGGFDQVGEIGHAEGAKGTVNIWRCEGNHGPWLGALLSHAMQKPAFAAYMLFASPVQTPLACTCTEPSY